MPKPQELPGKPQEMPDRKPPTREPTRKGAGKVSEALVSEMNALSDQIRLMSLLRIGADRYETIRENLPDRFDALRKELAGERLSKQERRHLDDLLFCLSDLAEIEIEQGMETTP